MKVQIYNIQEPEKWHNVLDCIGQADVYFMPEYHFAYQLNGDGVAYAFVAEENDHMLFYPFFVRPIEKVGTKSIFKSWYDIETVYGYSGPLCTTTDKMFLADAWDTFSAWCKENSIIAEFIRFNPLMQNHRYIDESCEVKFDRETVVVNLNTSEEGLWESYSSIQRNMVRKAYGKGLVCAESLTPESFKEFRRLYELTMIRVSANRYYYFSEAYFNYLYSHLGETVKLFVVRYNGQAIAAALFLLHDDRINYHLAGSNVRYRSFAPNNLLLHTVAQWGRVNGFRWLHLGGGATPEAGDGVFRFKASISELRYPFFIGKRVHNQEVYHSLCTEWLQQRKMKERPGYFLLYRLQEEDE